MRENREIPPSPACPDQGKGPLREGRGRKPEMNDGGKSDGPVIPAKPPNKAMAAEVVEGRVADQGEHGQLAGPGLRAGL